MLVWIFKMLFKLNGWKLNNKFPEASKHCVMVGAPHTSNWDLVYTVASLNLLKIPLRFTIKKEWLKPPFGWFVKPLGAIGIDRSKVGNQKDGKVQQIAALFAEHQELALVITPEGTRSSSPKIKSGFYHIAKAAQVPIVLAYLDYKNKEAGIGKLIYPNQDYETTLKEMAKFYATIPAKFPENNSFIPLAND
ncbi:1-acyl-sn-glycerol-3-phosphate acyltransferase [Luteibaculum oceani]|uniref:Acyltransferase n=1 Tax=Luteibaculum oceani TaxID=1294296 RepID=A0A5C6VK71_9FLAO|nr:1-acyl-sn-glycerol-3-phosphate acyltransferase [Luteibaculum oceani]TXC85399.1 acyltransferase [Luteibaculum oceani]